MMALGSFRARSFVLALTVLGGPGNTPRVTLQAPTQRLRLTINPATLRVGETARLTVDFLDSQFQPVANDRNRTIDFAQLPSGTGQAGSGTFSPSRVSVPRGAQSSATATFRAGSPGKVLIRATAPDLAPAQTLVVIVPHGSSWMDPSAHPTFRVAAYQQDITVEINPHEPTVVPANGVSRAQLWVTLNRRLNPDEELQIRVKSVPGVGVQVLYDGIRQGNVTDLTIGAGLALSKEVDILSTRPATVRVIAWVLPNGPSDEVRVQFERPRPARVMFEGGQDSIPLRQQEVPLAVELADQDHVPVGDLQSTWRIRLSSPTDPDVTTFTPETLVLTPGRPVGRSVLHLKGAPAANDIRLLAVDLGETLGFVERTIIVAGSIEPPAYLFVLFAGLGGVLGGLARDFYRRQVSLILPNWSSGYLHLGLLGNVPFSFLFGYVLFQAAALGLLLGYQHAPAIASTRPFAFFFGVLGGVGGIAVLDRLLDRIFPRRTGERPRPSDGASGRPSQGD